MSAATERIAELREQISDLEHDIKEHKEVIEQLNTVIAEYQRMEYNRIVEINSAK